MEKVIKVPILIPTFNPDVTLILLVRQLREIGFESIVVVNDGSNQSSNAVFDQLRCLPGVKVQKHAINRGKGAAIKTGLTFIQQLSSSATTGVITVDGDGQHLAEDVQSVASASLEFNESLILGSRSFSSSTPLRSRLGNGLTRQILSRLFNLQIKDSQTGLRFLPRSSWGHLLEIPGDRYEFELECLFVAEKLGIKVREVPIDTVYLEGNKSSHFRPLIDSFRIYAIFLRFSASGILSFLVDISFFVLLTSLTESVFASAVYARCISGTFNFCLNRTFVFKTKSPHRLKSEIFGYLLLWSVLNIVSAGLVAIIGVASLVLLAAMKILIDTSLFLVSFWVQKSYIFRQ